MNKDCIAKFEGGKNTRKGVELCWFFLSVYQNQGAQSEDIQREGEKDRQHKQLPWFAPQSKVGSVCLHFKRFFTIITQRLQLLKHTRDFLASHKMTSTIRV